MEEKTIETLKSIGLTNGEARVYLALISIGTSSVSNIVKTSEISSSKIYFILNKLIEKGLVATSVRDKVKIYTASDPDRIIDYLNDKEQAIQNNKIQALQIIQGLKSKRESIGKYPPIEFTKGKKGFETVFNEVYDQLKVGETYIGLAGNRISFELQDYWYKQSIQFSEKKISQLLVYEPDVWYKKDQSIAKRKQRKRYYPRILSKEFVDIPNILIFGDKVTISDVDDDGEVFTLLIRNKNLGKSMRKLIRAIYLSGKIPEGYKPVPKNIEF